MKIGIVIGAVIMVLGGMLAVSGQRAERIDREFGPLVVKETRTAPIHPAWGISVGLAGFALLAYCLAKNKED